MNGICVFCLTHELGHADLSTWNGQSGGRWPEPVVTAVSSQISLSPALPLTTTNSQGATASILSTCPTGLWVLTSSSSVSWVPPA